MKIRKAENNIGAGLVSTKRGITLIALIITIILMLILSGIVISLTIRRKWNIRYSKISF